MKKKIIGLCLSVLCIVLIPFNLGACSKDKEDYYLAKTVTKQYKLMYDDAKDFYYERVEEYRPDKQCSKRSINGSNTNEMVLIYNYDDSGLINTLEVYSEKTGNALIEFSYSLIDGKCVKKANYYDFDNSDNYEILYTYSKENRLLKYKLSIDNVTNKIIKEYDAYGKELSTTLYKDDKEGFTLVYELKYEYNGELVKRQTYTNSQETTVTNYKYEKMGENTMKCVVEDNTYYIISHFDDFGNEIERKIYNEDGNLVSETVNTYCQK